MDANTIMSVMTDAEPSPGGRQYMRGIVTGGEDVMPYSMNTVTQRMIGAGIVSARDSAAMKKTMGIRQGALMRANIMSPDAGTAVHQTGAGR